MLWTIWPSPTSWYSHESPPHPQCPAEPNHGWGDGWSWGLHSPIQAGNISHALSLSREFLRYGIWDNPGCSRKRGKILGCPHHLFMATASLTPFLAPCGVILPGLMPGKGIDGDATFWVTPPPRQIPVTKGCRGTWPSTRSCWRWGRGQMPAPYNAPTAPACRAVMPTRSCASAPEGRWDRQGCHGPPPPLFPPSCPPWSPFSPASPRAAPAPRLLLRDQQQPLPPPPACQEGDGPDPTLCGSVP